MGKKPCINCGIWVSWIYRNGCGNCGKVICNGCSVLLPRIGGDEICYCPVCCGIVTAIDIKKLQSKTKEAKILLNRGLELITCDRCNERQKRGAGNYCTKCGCMLYENKKLKLFKMNK